MPEWIERFKPEGWSDTELGLFGIGLTVVTAVGSIVVCALVAVRIPATYFVGDHPPRMWADRHPFVRWPLVVVKNLFGVFLVLIGIIMSFPGVPGQGILTILMGAMLLDFPGKRKAERWLLRRRGVLTGLNKVRKRYGREPLVLEDSAAAGNAPSGGEIPKMP
jgi:hypothetical protein